MPCEYTAGDAGQEKPRPGLLANISWLSVANAIVKPLWFLFITAACMRLLGVQEFGVLTAALSLTMIAAGFVDLGMAPYTVREVSRTPDKASLYFSNFMTLRIGNSLLAWGGAMLVAVLLDYRGSALLAVCFAGAYALTLNLTNYCRSVYQALENLRQEAVMLVVEKALVIGSGLLLLFATRSAAWTLAGMALGMTVTTGINILGIDRRFAKMRRSLVSRRFLKRSLKVMIPFGLAGLFTVMYYRVDMVMIEAMLGAVPTGQYGAAYRILEALYVLPTIVGLAAIYPRLARLYHDGAHADFGRLLRNGLLGLVGASVLVSFALAALSGTVIRLLDPDPAYAPAADALRILAWTFPFMCGKTLLYSALISMDRQRLAAIALGLAVFVNVALNAFMIPAQGIQGAAIATILTEVLLTGIFAVYYGRARFASATNLPLKKPGGTTA